MNTIIAPQRSLALPGSLSPRSLPSPLRRIARSLGLRLLRWGSRRPEAIDRDHHARLWHAQDDRAARELQWQSRALRAPLR